MEHLAEKAPLSLFQASLVKALRSANRHITHQAATHQLIYLFNEVYPMRLLKFDGRGEFTLTKNFDENVPCYAILSHTWGQRWQ
jgi:hypothetical protein